MIQPKKGGLYRTNCGAIVAFTGEWGANYCYSRTLKRGCDQCHFGIRFGIEYSWWNIGKYAGYWQSKEEDESFHLHLKEEILP